MLWIAPLRTYLDESSGRFSFVVIVVRTDFYDLRFLKETNTSVLLDYVLRSILVSSGSCLSPVHTDWGSSDFYVCLENSLPDRLRWRAKSLTVRNSKAGIRYFIRHFLPRKLPYIISCRQLTYVQLLEVIPSVEMLITSQERGKFDTVIQEDMPNLPTQICMLRGPRNSHPSPLKNLWVNRWWWQVLHMYAESEKMVNRLKFSNKLPAELERRLMEKRI